MSDAARRRGSAVLTLLILLFAGSTALRAQDAAQVIDLWTGPGPGDIADPTDDTIVPAKADEDPPTLRLTNVTRPQISVYRPAAETNAGVAIVICPGGGFNHLAYDKEGTQIAQWLTTLGVTGVVLKYRCPTRQDPRTQHVQPQQDAQRALRLVRFHADEWGVDSGKIGVCGFSAGGKVAALVATTAEGRTYEPRDTTVDTLAAKPDFAILIYPALKREAEQGLGVDGIRVTQRAPPMFIAYSADDGHPSPGALHLALALQQANVSCELHQYAAGGHGYGMRPSDNPASTWPARLEEWLRSTGILPQEN